MSRGPGKLQRTICEHFGATPAQTTYETLRWELLPRHRQLRASSTAPPATERLSTAWNTSFKRAVDGLAHRGERRLVIERRHLESFEELVRHYPGKSLDASTRQLRLRLLPVLAAIVTAGKQGPRYTPVDNEDFYFKSLAGDRREHLQATWKELEPGLMNLMLSMPAEHRTDVFLLIARAKSLLELKPTLLQCGRSIGECIRPLADRGILPPGLQAKLREFGNAVMPKGDTGFLSVKSYIHSLVDIPKRLRSAMTLKPETINLMDETCPEIMRTLPGYNPKRPKPTSPFVSYFGPRSKYSKEVKTLIDKTAFERFVFIRMA